MNKYNLLSLLLVIILLGVAATGMAIKIGELDQRITETQETAMEVDMMLGQKIGELMANQDMIAIRIIQVEAMKGCEIVLTP